MGQAGAAPDTLPDPNEPAITAATSADDLLAQLAGEEIDRLLAETEDGTAPLPGASAPAPGVQPQPSSDATRPVETPVNAASESIDTVEKIGDQLDELLKEIEAPKTELESESPAPTTSIAQFAAATSNNEVNALLGEQVGGAAVADEIDDGLALPAYVRVLEFLNAPFAAMPDALREFLGKVAILTMFNSIAVLLYVLIFRRH